MKGTVLSFGIQTNSGVISGDDGNRYSFVGSEWKAEGFPVAGQHVDFVISDSSATQVYGIAGAVGVAVAAGQSTSQSEGYYETEFKKIAESGEKYKGSWNWGAFFFGWIWALVKGAWQSAALGFFATTFILVFISSTERIAGVHVTTSPILKNAIFILINVLYASRGTYILYNVKVKHRQVFI